jgi:flagellar basal-body rod modification protein FlgD
MAITTTTGITTAQNESDVSHASAEDRQTLDRDDFLKLFITQLSYQDPMNPMESAEMASQVAQFNMVDLMYKNNEAIESLVASEESATRLQAVGFLGHEVRYAGNSLTVGPDGPGSFDLELERAAASCVAVITNENNQVVRTLDLGALGQGKHALAWDGADAQGEMVPEGTYNVMVAAVNETGNEVQVATWTAGTVTQVVYPETGLPTLTVQDGTEIAMDELWMVGN